MKRVLAIAAFVAVLAGCGGAKTASHGGTSSRPRATGQLTDLHSVEQLASLFNADAGKPRLVLLMSPT